MTPSGIVTGTSPSSTMPFVSGRSYFVHFGAADAAEGSRTNASRAMSAILRTIITSNDRPAWKIALGDVRGNDRGDADPRSRRAQREARGVPRGRKCRHAVEGVVVRAADQR